jgi:hypothetical protein
MIPNEANSNGEYANHQQVLLRKFTVEVVRIDYESESVNVRQVQSDNT